MEGEAPERAGNPCTAWQIVGCEGADVVILFQIYPSTPPDISLPFIGRIPQCVSANFKQAPNFSRYAHLLLISRSLVLLSRSWDLVSSSFAATPSWCSLLLNHPLTLSVCLRAWALNILQTNRSNSVQRSWFKTVILISYRMVLAWDYFWYTTCLLDVKTESFLQLVGRFWCLHWCFIFSNLGYSDGNALQVALTPRCQSR